MHIPSHAALALCATAALLAAPPVSATTVKSP